MAGRNFFSYDHPGAVEVVQARGQQAHMTFIVARLFQSFRWKGRFGYSRQRFRRPRIDRRTESVGADLLPIAAQRRRRFDLQ
jgi:hypothetical protein